MQPDWIELKTARLIARAKRSQYARDIFADAKAIHAEGYVMDVALMKSLQYWEGNPITGLVSGI
jgi:acetyl-CoA carboxylase alpha subunit